MRKFVITPEECSREGSAWKGTITVRPFSLEEKYSAAQGMGISMSDDGTVDTSAISKNVMPSIISLIKISEQNYLSVDLKNDETGEVITSFKELQYFSEFEGDMIKIALKLVQGVSLGNVSRPQ